MHLFHIRLRAVDHAPRHKHGHERERVRALCGEVPQQKRSEDGEHRELDRCEDQPSI